MSAGLRRAWRQIGSSVERAVGGRGLEALSGPLAALGAPLARLPLAEFTSAADLAPFAVTTDSVLGASGASTASLTLRRSSHFSAARFAGTIDWRDESPQSRGGFAAFRTSAAATAPPRDLTQFGALELRVKTDGRPCVVGCRSCCLLRGAALPPLPLLYCCC